MNNLQKILEMLFKRVSPEEVINDRIIYDQFTEKEFIKLSHSYQKKYSDDEVLNMLEYYKSNFERQKIKFNEFSNEYAKGEINVFSALFSYCDEVLTLKENQVLCQYKYLLNWRELASIINEDIFIAAYMARQTNHMKTEDVGFSWDVVTRHNNARLYLILQKGISENHFHFWGSIPIFQMSWISLMNNVTSSKMLEYLREYDDEKRDTNIKYSKNYIEKPLSIQYLQAAYIRMLLFSFLTETKIKIGSYKIYYKEILKKLRGKNLPNGLEKQLKNLKCRDFFATQTVEKVRNKLNEAVEIKSCTWLFREIFLLAGENNEDMYRDVLNENPIISWILNKMLSETTVTREIAEEIEECIIKNQEEKMKYCLYQMLLAAEVNLETLYDFLPKDVFNQFWQQRTLKNVKKILKSSFLLTKYRSELQDVIDGFNANYRTNALEHKKYKLEDYMLYSIDRRGANGSFSGENWLLYSMFQKVNSTYYKKDEHLNLFYAYILLRENIHSEIVQVNDKVGFSNFQKYQSRKGDLIEDEMFLDYDVQKALSYNLLKDNMESLEVRITPPETIRKMRKQIRDIDQLINPDKKKSTQDRYFYVYHFIKELESANSGNAYLRCRHYKKREEIEQRAKEIIKFRRKDSSIAKRVLGIDACSSEIGCRPEIFASAFRFLSNHVVLNSKQNRESFVAPEYRVAVKKKFKDFSNELPQLRITYHAGEEFLDVADGLRAIDEAMLFFNLDCGDRLGHAIALGINVEEWYRVKGNRILISKQDYLDNIVWMHGRIVELGVEGQEELKDYLQKEFSLYFKEIYENYIDPETVRIIFKKMEKEYQKNKDLLPYGVRNYKPNFDIHSYYRAWKLRGDDPLYYKNGYFEYNRFSVENSFDFYRINREFPAHFEIRYMPDVALLYYYYHYSTFVRKKGEMRIEKEISPLYIKGVKVIQKKMQELVGIKGIAIETNPSSNYLISTFRDYRKHPIIEFYNNGLEIDPEKLAECPQLCVSINTDDKGVFSTTLENEYSLMACALENMKNPDGSFKYSREQIYEWLEHIREMGNMQSFQSEYQKNKVLKS